VGGPLVTCATGQDAPHGVLVNAASQTAPMRHQACRGDDSVVSLARRCGTRGHCVVSSGAASDAPRRRRRPSGCQAAPPRPPRPPPTGPVDVVQLTRHGPSRPRAARHPTARRLGRAVHWVATEPPSGRRRADKDGGGEPQKVSMQALTTGGPVPDRAAAREKRTPAQRAGPPRRALFLTCCTSILPRLPLVASEWPHVGTWGRRSWTTEAPAARCTRPDHTPEDPAANPPRGTGEENEGSSPLCEGGSSCLIALSQEVS